MIICGFMAFFPIYWIGVCRLEVHLLCWILGNESGWWLLDFKKVLDLFLFSSWELIEVKKGFWSTDNSSLEILKGKTFTYFRPEQAV